MLLRAEAFPPGSHAHIRRDRYAVAVNDNGSRKENQRRISGHDGKPWLRHFRSRRSRDAYRGSNLGGLISPFLGEKIRGERDYRIIAVEPASCPSFTRGVFAYDFCDTGHVCPLAKMYTLGSEFIPSANHAGGLRYHGMSSILSQAYHDKLIEARSVEQTNVFKAAEYFARVEGILPAPESSHAISAAIDEALKCKETGESKTIVFGLTGTGYFDLKAYEAYNNGTMSDYIPTDADLKKSIDLIPRFPGNLM